ncbi:FAD/NAD(P)-binding domain-containing protein [Cylindrobasidium torrendii FP15055 ss-10]|uniref:FAD/NAD(P)-binding domain-containing protein n=1 Tax=Cylindrobasidium torrendii FP15055 ss-10 TaxID=1314674 RepID=A0A0D7AUQ6_9AGAR|nr:FAD/NAD(P)-binding domain-containing protein [Cylindrobasidium torrendii FP15055 ss-10]
MSIQGARKTIAIIGGGPAGLAALKTVLDTDEFKAGLWHPTVFEAREKVGGVWLPAEPVDNPPLTPLYDSLTTNLPHPVMAFTSLSFPPETPLFPKAKAVEDYLLYYAHHFGLNTHIQLNTSVEQAVWTSPVWRVSLSTGRTLDFDWVIVCNGHYRKPRYPVIPGLDDWVVRNKASHSAWYRRPHELGSTVMVVGAGPSGQDISAEMCEAADSVIHSTIGTPASEDGKLKRRGRPIEFHPDGSVLFEGDIIEKGIDHCILATGYEVEFPFLSSDILRSTLPPPIPPLPTEAFNSSYHVFPLAKHIFPLQARYPPESLTFLGLLVRVAPFPILEAQALAVVQAYRTPLDVEAEAKDILVRYQLLTKASDAAHPKLDIARNWHKFEGEEQFDYRDETYRWAGGSIVVPDWEKEMYEEKGILRQTWVELEKSGEAAGWVKGVGKNGDHEWVDLLKRLLAYAKSKAAA